MSGHIQAIQTFYKGYHFRSRLEARWAVFFDALGYKWEYEPEGFELPGGVRYLPDFRTTSPTGLVVWYEVKPMGVTSDPKVSAANKPIVNLFGLADEPGMGVRILSGDPLEHIAMGVPGKHGDPAETVRVCPRCGLIDVPGYGFDTWDEKIFGCGPCDMDTPDGGGNDTEVGMFAYVTPYKGVLVMDQSDMLVWLAYVHRGADIARAARFEHGVKPHVKPMNAILCGATKAHAAKMKIGQSGANK